MVGRRQSTGARMRLGEPLRAELADYCAVVYETDEIKIIRRAVKEHIERMLLENDGIRRDYENLRHKRLSSERLSENGSRLRPV